MSEYGREVKTNLFLSYLFINEFKFLTTLFFISTFNHPKKI